MKSIVFVLSLLLSLVAFAETQREPTPAHLQYQEELLYCQTASDNYLVVLRNKNTDLFTILYGEDLRNPKQAVSRQGNNMGTSYRANVDDGVENREIYLASGQEFTTIGVTDKQGKKTGYYTLLSSHKEVVHEECKPSTLVSHFDDYEQFQSLTDVD